MKKNIFIFLICLIFCNLAQAQNSVIDFELQKILNQKSDDYVDVNIMFKQQMSSEELQALNCKSDSKEIRREIAINALKKHSEQTQKDVMSVIKAEERSSNVIDVKTYWIANIINCKAKRDVIYQLASHPDIEAITFNSELEVIENAVAGSETRATSEAEITQHLTQINADDVWNLGYTGKGVIVAVLDSGVNTDHIDLKDHLWTGNAQHGYNVVNPGSAPIDERSHGTHCAGIVCGDGTSGKITGVAPDATLMSIKLYGQTASFTLDTFFEAIEFAVNNKADILSISQGWLATSTSIRESVRTTFNNLLDIDIVAAVAAGNDRQNTTYPAPYNVRTPGDCPPPWLNPNQTVQGGKTSVISVGAVDYSNTISNISSQGPVTWAGTSFNDYPYNNGASMGLIRPDIVAPGHNIVSLDSETNNGTAIKAGTSMAAPCVAGVMALMLEKNPDLKPADLCRIIETTATKITSTKSNDYGSGVIDALAAVQAVNFNTSGPVLTQYSFNSVLNATANQNFDLTLINNGNGATTANTSVTITTSDAYVSVVNGTQSYGTMASGATASKTFILSANNLTPDNHKATLTVTMSGGYNASFDIVVTISNELVPPTDIVATVAGKNVTLSWSATNNATSYNIYRDDAYLTNVTGTSFSEELEFGTLYRYTITSKRNTLESEKSLVKFVQTEDNPDVPSPKNVKANNGAITWTNSTGSKSSNVYRKANDVETLLTSNQSGTSYTDNTWSTLANGVYQYGVSNNHASAEEIYAEDFESHTLKTTANDNEWYIYYQNLGSSGTWKTNWRTDSKSTNGDFSTPYGSNAAFFNSTANNSNYLSFLVTPRFDYTQYNGDVVKLSFYYITPSWSGDINTLKVKISASQTDCYSSEVIWSNLNNNQPQDVSTWTKVEIDLSEYIGNAFYIAFENTTGAGYCTGIDNVSIGLEGSKESRIEWTENIYKGVNIFATDGNWNTNSNWATKQLPTENEDVVIAANAIINGNVTAKSITINEGASLTLNEGAKLTVTGDFINTNADAFIINDGAQVVQNNNDVAATFNMDIVNPDEWSNDNKTGWQFIASPMKDAKINDFILIAENTSSGYDIYKYDGNKDLEWINHKDENEYEEEPEKPSGPFVVEIGADQNPDYSGNFYLPVYDYAKYAISQQIYTKEEIGHEGEYLINSVSFRVGSGSQATRQYEVYLKNTDQNEFSGNSYIAMSAADKVYDGSVEVGAADSWYTINFTAPFNYTGGNVVLCIYDKTGTGLGNSDCHRFYKFSASKRSLYSQGSSSYNATSLSTGQQQTYVSQVKFEMDEKPEMQQVEIGTDQNPDYSGNYYLPVYDYARYAISQQIYTKDEIGYDKGSIHNVSFKIGYGSQATRQYEVYMKNIDQSSFSGNNYIAMSAADKVYDGSVEVGAADSWYTINFTAPFNYTGGNVVLCVYDKTGTGLGISGYHQFYKFSASGRSLYSQGSSSYNATSLSTGSSRTYVSVVRFDITPYSGGNEPQAPEAPQNLTATTTGASTIDLTWDNVADADSYNIYKDGTLLDNVAETSYTATGLEASKTYCFTVTAVNGDLESEASEETCATTDEAELGDVCTVIFTLTDSYGDGWGSNTLTVSYGDVSEVLTFIVASYSVKEYSKEYTLAIPTGAHVTVKYATSGSYAYPDENSFDIKYESGEEIHRVEAGSLTTSGYTFDFTVNCTPTAPDAPVATATPKSSTGITLKWDAVGGAESYNIYQYESLLATTTETSYIVGGLTASTQYCFAVTAENKIGESEQSEKVCATTFAEGPATVSIGDGTIANMSAPIYNAYGGSYSLSQQIYTAEEIGVNSGKITSVSFHHAAGNNNVRDIVVYIQNTDKTSFSGNSDWFTFSDSDIVYQGTFNFGKAEDWVTIKFQNEFEYTGSNIALTVYDKTGTNYGYNYDICDKFYSSQTNELRGLYYIKSSAMDLTQVSSYYGSKMNTGNWVNPVNVNYINNIKLFINTSGAKSAATVNLNAGFVPAAVNNSSSAELSFEETTFQQGVGYMASYQSETTAVFKGILNHEKSYSFDVSYNSDKNYANFHLLGNPFSFNMNWNDVTANNMATGYVTVTTDGGYEYHADGEIKVGDGFFVKATGENPSVSYGSAQRSNSVKQTNYINVIASGNAGDDNVIIMQNDNAEGFPKLKNFNENIANIFVAEEEQSYGVYNCDADVQEVELAFEAKQMGNYSIIINANGNYDKITLIDRLENVESDMLTNNEYRFFSKIGVNNRFLVKFSLGNGTDNQEHFAYQSGDELIINAEGDIQIFDVMGRLVYSNDVDSDNRRINVSNFNRATYIVRCISDNNVRTQKIVIL